MLIPPIGFGRPSVSGPSEFAPEQELKTLLDIVDQIRTHMSQNRTNPALVERLYKEFSETLKQIDHFASQLPRSEQDGFKVHLEELKVNMQKFHNSLIFGDSSDQLHSTSMAVFTTQSQLLHDLGLPASKRSFY